MFAAYANDSSHILLGAAENRKLLEFGASYSRRLLANRVVNWQYDVEFMPVALESDPVAHLVVQETSPEISTVNFNTRLVGACRSGTQNYSYTEDGTTFAYTLTTTCGRIWTQGEAFSPVGMRWNFRPRHRLQPFFGGHGGEMYTTTAIPMDNAGSFNFTFDFGAGVEFFRSARRSYRVEYRYHHISNHNTAEQNPGIDNGVIQVSYVFGR